PTPIPATDTPTPTITPTPVALVVGHVTWQGRPPHPDALQSLPITLTLRPSGGGSALDYAGLSTDAMGFFTVTVAGPGGSYNWRVKSAQPNPRPLQITLGGWHRAA